MSEENDMTALLIANVMAAVQGLRLNADEFIHELRRKVAEGDRVAKETLNNPWNTSTPAKHAIASMQIRLNKAREKMIEVGPVFLAAWLEHKQLEGQLESFQAGLARMDDNGVPGSSAEFSEGHQRILEILIRQSGITNRDGQRASIETINRAGRMIKRQVEERWCDEVVSVPELTEARIIQHVSTVRGWSLSTGAVDEDRWQERSYQLKDDPSREFPFDNFMTRLPSPIVIDPPCLPRSWKESDRMHSVLWDALPAEPYYRSFIRQQEEGENLAFNWDVFGFDEGLPLPAYLTLDTMKRFDPDFREAYMRADRRARVLEVYQAKLEDIGINCWKASSRKRDIELLDWAFPVGKEVLFDTALWDAWRPWATLIAALKDYLNFKGVGEPGCPVYAWLYFLKGRLAKTDSDLPPFVREALFDWMMLPVPSSATPAVRILVPRDRLQPLVEGQR